ncbi:MAG: M20/M25/M40 family metallo-hydrolase [Clostridiales bacterium]|nr:M20/M25/M40 family metallo-hydrolase [Clostridiales bacterium]
MNYEIDEKYLNELVRLTMDLVDIPTENHPPDGDEAVGIAFIRRYFEDMGFDVDEYSPMDLPEYPDHPLFLERNFTGRHNLDVVWKGAGGGRSLLLSGHMDVAPKEPLPWTVTQPFSALEKDGRIYGRGSADMKGGLACAVIAAKMLRERGFVPKGDVILEVVVDEEYAGANGTLAGRLKGYNADFAVNMEPTGLDVCPACVGAIILKVGIKGTAGMPFTGEEISNPAYDIADLLQLVRAYGEKRAAEAPAPEVWKDTLQGVQVITTKVKAGEATEDGQMTLPLDAWCEVIIQYYPGEDEDRLVHEFTEYLRANFAGFDKVSVEKKYRYCKAASSDPDHPGVTMLSSCVKGHSPDEGHIRAAMFSCDMEMFTGAGGMAAVEFGPKGERLHAPDEWVSIDSLRVCAQSIAGFIVEWCG